MNYPKSIYVYVGDWDGAEPIYHVSTSLEDVPEGNDGETIGHYSLDTTGQFAVSRSLK